MNSLAKQNVIPYPGIVLPSSLQHGDSSVSTLRRRIAHFDFGVEDWASDSTAVLYKRYTASANLKDRDTLYAQVLEDVVRGDAKATGLLLFATFEPHAKIACRAVQDYLTHRSCNIDDEFAGVHEIIGILANRDSVNKGAILAGLLSVGDRRVNAVARAARQLLSEDDIRSFSRVQNSKMRSSTVEFCLDWLLELNQQYCKRTVCHVASALMLMVVNDQYGVVEDMSEINYIGFKTTKVLQTQTFESYYSEILPIMKYLKKCEGFESSIAMITEAWNRHEAAAPLLRE